MRPIARIAATVSSRPWRSLLLVLCSASSACSTYGSIESLATAEVLTSASELTGRWRAPDQLRCRHMDSFGEGLRWSPEGVYDARGDDSGEVRVTGVPDTACPRSAGQPGDTTELHGALVRLGSMRVLELSLSEERLDATLLPLRQWFRVTRLRDTLLLEALSGDSLAAWLRRSPTLTPHLYSPRPGELTDAGRLVLTGDSQQLQSFARRAFAEPSVVPDTIVLVRIGGAEAGGP